MTRLAERIGFRSEAGRKAIHLVTGSLPVMYSRGLEREVLVVLLGSASVIAVVVEWMRHLWPGAETTFERAVGSMLREHERRAITGATWLAVASFAVVLFLPPKPAIATLWCATVADPLATIAGRAQWRGLPSRPGKSRVGSVTCMIVAFAGAWLIAGFAPGPALAIAGVAMLAERFPGPFDDNLTVSAGVALIASVVA
jgi:dolichol kinase